MASAAINRRNLDMNAQFAITDYPGMAHLAILLIFNFIAHSVSLSMLNIDIELQGNFAGMPL